MSRSQYFCFTLNNYTEQDQASLRALINSPRVSYIIFGREVSASNTPHLQGYIEFTQRLRLNQLQEYLPTRCANFTRRGTGQQAADYCKKEGDFEEFGELRITHQGWDFEWSIFFNRLRQTHGPVIGGRSHQVRIQ